MLAKDVSNMTGDEFMVCADCLAPPVIIHYAGCSHANRAQRLGEDDDRGYEALRDVADGAGMTIAQLRASRHYSGVLEEHRRSRHYPRMLEELTR